jgi:hypothetical protein
VLRRTGYILGLLFVAACAAAYPLTWGRYYRCAYMTEQYRYAFAAVTCGQARLCVHRPTHLAPPWPFGFHSYKSSATPARRVAFAIGADTVSSIDGGIVVYFPLWMPALAISLLMVWGWRRSRHRQSTGFPVDQRTTDLTNRST